MYGHLVGQGDVVARSPAGAPARVRAIVRANRAPVRDGTSDSRVQARRWWTLGVLCTALLVVIIDNTILNVAC